MRSGAHSRRRQGWHAGLGARRARSGKGEVGSGAKRRRRQGPAGGGAQARASGSRFTADARAGAHNAPPPRCASLPHQLAGPRVCALGRERGLGRAEEREPRPRGAQQSPERLSTSHSPGPQKIAAKAESSS